MQGITVYVTAVTKVKSTLGFELKKDTAYLTLMGELWAVRCHLWVSWRNWIISWWRHQMETLSALLGLCEDNPPVTDEFPSQRPVTWGFDVFFDLRLNTQLSKHLRHSDLRHHRAHYEATVMMVARLGCMLYDRSICWARINMIDVVGLSFHDCF